jgi:hypothetical protein
VLNTVFVKIGEGVEVGADDLAHFFEDIGAEAKAAVSPRALIALALLASAAEPVVIDALAAAAQDGANIPLDMETLTLLMQLWPEFKAYLATLTIQPSKTVILPATTPPLDTTPHVP